MQNSLEQKDFITLKEKLENLYKVNNIIHIDIMQKRKKINNVEAKIEGVYNRFICVTSMVGNYAENFTISYIDLMMNKIVIKELE